ncbi:hypothetical protein GGX14DRAFT_612010 [Mycena pura]|uniref:Uncharacterized protein n=1 Tax=Mycena pura TaxID=153505 RepID=A0AAD6YSB3_9AGAR|nr:hypothetical protein GGX14DRAFT_612010 [Mycena pura]
MHDNEVQCTAGSTVDTLSIVHSEGGTERRTPGGSGDVGVAAADKLTDGRVTGRITAAGGRRAAGPSGASGWWGLGEAGGGGQWADKRAAGLRRSGTSWVAADSGGTAAGEGQDRQVTSEQRAESRDKQVNKRPVDDEQQDLPGPGRGRWRGTVGGQAHGGAAPQRDRLGGSGQWRDRRAAAGRQRAARGGWRAASGGLLDKCSPSGTFSVPTVRRGQRLLLPTPGRAELLPSSCSSPLATDESPMSPATMSHCIVLAHLPIISVQPASMANWYLIKTVLYQSNEIEHDTNLSIYTETGPPQQRGRFDLVATFASNGGSDVSLASDFCAMQLLGSGSPSTDSWNLTESSDGDFKDNESLDDVSCVLIVTGISSLRPPSGQLMFGKFYVFRWVRAVD